MSPLTYTWCWSAKSAKLVILASLFGLLASPVKAQVAFSPPTNVSNSVGFSGSEQVAIDVLGNINVVWTHQNSTPPFTSAIFFSRSSDGGLTFATPMAISHAGSNAGQATIAVGTTGSIYIVWDDTSLGSNALFFTSSIDGGLTFSTPQMISNAGATSVVPGPLAVDTTGNVDLLWSDNGSGIWAVFFSQSTDGGATFSAPTSLSGNLVSTGYSQMAVDKSSNVYAVWTASGTPSGPTDVFFTASTNQGTSFSPPTNLSNNSSYVEVLNPQLAADSTSNIDVVWAWWNTSASNSEFTTSYRHSSDGGLSFTTPHNFLSSCADCPMFAQVAQDSLGAVSLVWADFGLLSGGSASPLNYVRTPDGGETFTGQMVPGTAPSSPPQMAIDAANDIDVVFAQISGIQQQSVLFTQSSNHGAAFSAPQTISTVTYSVSPIVATDKLNNAYVLWSQTDASGSNSNIFLSRSVGLSSLGLSLPIVIAGQTTIATVTLSGPAPVGGAVIALWSSNSASVLVPEFVTIPEGNTSATFGVAASPSAATGAVQIMASFNGVTQTSSLRVRGIHLHKLF